MKTIGSQNNKDKGKVLADIPTLGRPVLLGELYSVYSDQFIPGFSLWKPEDIEKTKRIVYHPGSKTEFSADNSREKKFDLLKVTAELSVSVEAGMVTVDGSATYLNPDHDLEEKAKVTLSYQSTTRTEALSSDLSNKTKLNCDVNIQDKNSHPTHVVASITYGGDCHFVFEKDLSKTDNKKDIYGRLHIVVNLIEEATTIDGQASVTLNDRDRKLRDELTVTLYSDFILPQQPRTFNESLKVYKDVSTNFGTKNTFYNQSVPMKMTLVPLAAYCTGLDKEIADIEKSILESATKILVRLKEVLAKISKLLGSVAAENNFLVKQLLLQFQSGVSNYTLYYEAELQKNLIGARNPNISSITTEEIVYLISNDTISKYNYNTHLFLYLTQRTRQVNALNIFYTQTVAQDQPQIASYSEADVPIAIITERVLFLLTLNVLPNVTEYNYTTWLPANEKNRWYNNRTIVGEIGDRWRDFRTFFHINEYQEGTNYFVLFDEEENTTTTDPMHLQLYINGKKNNFELAKLLELKIEAKVQRNYLGLKILLSIQQPTPFTHATTTSPIQSPVNSITGILVIVTNQFLSQPTFRKIYKKTDEEITIENIVPEYTYNISISYTTEYGSLTPTIITSAGTFDQMEQTVGCKIQRNLMNLNITKDHQQLVKGITADKCATLCHAEPTCSYGWTFQIATGNCFFNKQNSNTTRRDGWAVGTQSCQGPVTMAAACDDDISVYFDGDYAFGGSGWHNVFTGPVPPETKVIGIACQDKKGGAYGIVASTENGVVTDDAWECSSTLVEGWNKPGFLDTNSVFSSPPQPGTQYRGAQLPTGIANEAKAIWGPGSAFSWAYCKKWVSGKF